MALLKSGTHIYGNLTVDTYANIGGNIQVTTTGSGILFNPAVVGAGRTTNTMADYEEGTWTPTDGSGAGISLSGGGHYVKIGRLVYASFNISYASNSNGTANQITGLPFANDGTDFGGLVTVTNYGSSFTIFGNTSNGFQFRNYVNTALLNSAFSGSLIRGIVIYLAST